MKSLIWIVGRSVVRRRRVEYYKEKKKTVGLLFFQRVARQEIFFCGWMLSLLFLKPMLMQSREVY